MSWFINVDGNTKRKRFCPWKGTRFTYIDFCNEPNNPQKFCKLKFCPRKIKKKEEK